MTFFVLFIVLKNAFFVLSLLTLMCAIRPILSCFFYVVTRHLFMAYTGLSCQLYGAVNLLFGNMILTFRCARLLFHIKTRGNLFYILARYTLQSENGRIEV